MRDYPEFCIFQAQFIAQSIGQAFQVAYVEFLKANGIEDHSFVKEMDYQEVLNSQEIFGNELALFAKKELQKEVINLSIPGIRQTTINFLVCYLIVLVIPNRAIHLDKKKRKQT